MTVGGAPLGGGPGSHPAGASESRAPSEPADPRHRESVEPRPRDRLGRPVTPGDPRAVPVAALPDPPATPAVIAAAESFLAAGMPWHAHECFEAAWRAAGRGSDARPAWRALAQWGAALTHAARGNAAGADSVGSRAADGLAAAAAAGVRLVDDGGRALDLAAIADLRPREVASAAAVPLPRLP